MIGPERRKPMCDDNKLFYWKEAKVEFVRLVDNMLIGFAEDIATDKNLLPSEFTGRMQGAMAVAKRIKIELMRKEGTENDAG